MEDGGTEDGWAPLGCLGRLVVLAVIAGVELAIWQALGATAGWLLFIVWTEVAAWLFHELWGIARRILSSPAKPPRGSG